MSNQTPLTRSLLLKGGVAIVDLEQANNYIAQRGNAAFHWQTATVAVEDAIRDPKRIGHATDSLENALRTDKVLA
jgi:hypothetical protein